MKKTLFFVFILFFNLIFCFSEQVVKPDYIIDDKRVFLEAKIAFDEKDYGLALKLVDRAKTLRKQKVKWEVYTLENSLKPAEVKIVGDNIIDIKKVLLDRQDFDALDIIARYEKYYSLDYFDSSSKKLISFIKNRIMFPEADFLAGKVYQIEGEYDIAEKFLLQSYENSSILDVPDDKYEILYSLADISYTKKDFNKYEELLLLIISQDKFFNDKNLKSAMKRTISSTKKDCVEKFFLMYQVENFKLLNAYFLLSEYYQKNNDKDRSLTTAALGALTGFSKIYDVVSKRNPEFQYNGIESLFYEVSSYSDIVDWGINNNVWKGFNDFAENAFKNNCSYFSIMLYSILKDSSPEEYWRKEAKVRLDVITGKLQNSILN